MPNNPNISTAENELLECPCCKAPARIERIEAHTHHLTKWMPDYKGGEFVECTKCTLCASSVEQWNTRTHPNADNKLVEALEDIARVAKEQQQPYCQERAEQALAKLKDIK